MMIICQVIPMITQIMMVLPQVQWIRRQCAKLGGGAGCCSRAHAGFLERILLKFLMSLNDEDLEEASYCICAHVEFLVSFRF